MHHPLLNVPDEVDPLDLRIRTDSIASITFRRKRPKRVTHYVLGPTMGDGIYGTVRDAIYLNAASCERVSVKCIQKNLRSRADAKRIEALLRNEVDYLQRFFHENVVRANDIFCSIDGRDYLVMPVAVCSLQQFLDVRTADLSGSFPSQSFGSPQPASGDPVSNLFMFTKARLLPLPLVKDVMFQIMSGVAYLHKQNVYHNDINLGNILLFADGTVKLSDLGCCGPQLIGRGTPAFVSPQAAGAADESENVDGAKNDVWSCGVILYLLMTDEWPIPLATLENEFDVYRAIRETDINFRAVEELVSGAVSLVRGMLDKDQQHRLTAMQVLEHPWLQKETITKSYIQSEMERKSSGLSASKRESTSSRQHNVRRIFNVKEIDRMIEMDRKRHKAFAHELRYILGLSPRSRQTQEAMNQLLPTFLPKAEFLHYQRKGRPDIDVRSLLVDPVKMHAIDMYCANVLEHLPLTRPVANEREDEEEDDCCKSCVIS